MRNLGSSLSIGLCLSFLGGDVLAQSECETSEDCAQGMVCEVVGISGCPGTPDCKPGEDCPEVAPCEPEEFMACVAGPCESDEDCGPDMVCHAEQSETCGGAASVSCDEDGNCEAVTEQPACESGSDSRCIYRWQEQCQTDGDCGDGFTCEQRELGCDCAASGGSAAVDPAVAPADAGTDANARGDGEGPPEAVPEDIVADCDCGEPETVGYCRAQEVECETHADCPDNWSCEALPQVDCGGGTATSGSTQNGTDVGAPPPDEQARAMDAGVAEGDSDQGGGEPAVEDPDVVERPAVDEDCAPVDAPLMCVPPGGYGYDTGSSGGVATASDEPREQSAGKGEDGQVVNDDGEAAAPHDDVAENADEGDAKKNSVSSSGHGSGCSVNVPGGRTPSGLWLSALFGLLLLRRKRTTQWRI